MVRVVDYRMSGTSFALVLHVSPEAAIGGPLAIVRMAYDRTWTPERVINLLSKIVKSQRRLSMNVKSTEPQY